jgi:hypothetical protein
MHNELRERGIELPISERQRLCRRALRPHARVARPHRGDERLRGIDRRHGCRADAIAEDRRQRPRATPNIEDPLTHSDTAKSANTDASGIK